MRSRGASRPESGQLYKQRLAPPEDMDTAPRPDLYPAGELRAALATLRDQHDAADVADDITAALANLDTVLGRASSVLWALDPTDSLRSYRDERAPESVAAAVAAWRKAHEVLTRWDKAENSELERHARG